MHILVPEAAVSLCLGKVAVQPSPVGTRVFLLPRKALQYFNIARRLYSKRRGFEFSPVLRVVENIWASFALVRLQRAPRQVVSMAVLLKWAAGDKLSAEQRHVGVFIKADVRARVTRKILACSPPAHRPAQHPRLTLSDSART